MIRRLSGTIVEKSYLSVVLNVNGVGYLLHVARADNPALKEKANVTLHTYLAVRENALDLYGFLEKEELEMFELLISLPKIGPKSAMQILSQADLALLRKAAISNDPVYLTKMSGIGKKSAEKIVVGLREKLDGDDVPLEDGEKDYGDVIDALVTLGYSQRDARGVVQKLPEELTSTNERIKEALKILGSI